ncbi:MAG TPA: pilus assembly PilX N-terminal domain-containing protein [Patescibacteria group bacterium]
MTECNNQKNNFVNKNYSKNRQGSAIAYGLIIMSVTAMILVSMLQYISAQLKFTGNRVEREKSFQIAESGIYFYRWYLAHEISGKTAQQIKYFWKNGSPYGVAVPYEAEYSDPEGGPIGKYQIEVQAPDLNSTIVIIKSTGWTYKSPGVKRIIQARFRRPSWSEYAVLADDNMRFGEGTQIYGKIHSNYGIRFDGVAHNIISSSLYSYDDPDHSGGLEFGVHTHISPTDPVNPVYPTPPPNRSDVFEAGRQMPLPTISFNGVLSDLNFMKTEAQAGRGKYFNNLGYGRRIILKNNGTYDVCTVNSYDTISKSITNYAGVVSGATKNHGSANGSACVTTACCATSDCANLSGSGNGKCVSLANYNIVTNGVIFVENNVWLEGTINNKKTTIVAANLIGGPQADAYIGINSILYTNFDGKDIIGLIGQKDISVVRDSQSTLTIDAALLAQSGRVGRDYYSGSYNKNTITVNGSIATKLRYGFAYTDGTGYVNRILNFDNNLLYYPPPYFPTGTEYYIDLWDEL